jgi:hypothetical protein
VIVDTGQTSSLRNFSILHKAFPKGVTPNILALVCSPLLGFFPSLVTRDYRIRLRFHEFVVLFRLAGFPAA